MIGFLSGILVSWAFFGTWYFWKNFGNKYKIWTKFENILVFPGAMILYIILAFVFSYSWFRSILIRG